VLILAFLIPEYHSYTNTCVNHIQNDTFLSSNMGAAAVNYASLAGNGKFTSGIVEYNMQINHLCSEDIVSSKFSSFVQSLFVHGHSNDDDFSSSSSVTYAQYLQNLQSRNSSYQVSLCLLLCADLYRRYWSHLSSFFFLHLRTLYMICFLLILVLI
jgi:hypothetical protein